MTQHVDDIDAAWAVHWMTPGRGEWTADRHGRAIGQVRREAEGYVARRGRRTLGTYRSLDAALDAVDHRNVMTLQPSRFWAVLLTSINVGIIAAISLVATAILR